MKVVVQGKSLRLWLAAALLLRSIDPVGAATGAAGVPKDLKLPAAVVVAVYLPAQVRRWHGPVQGMLGSGRTLEDTVLSVAPAYFQDSHMAESGSDAPFGLLLALHPEVKSDSGHLTVELAYAVFAADDQPLLKGSESVVVAGLDLDRAFVQATQQVMTVTINGLRPDASKFPAALSLKARSLEFAARQDKPWGNGTGFYFNASGQVVTAAHVIQDCVKVVIKRDEHNAPGKVLAKSNVIDVAALDTGTAAPAFLPFRRALDFELGEPVTNVGFPLQSILAATPNLTRGNISARGGLTGSVGQFQFSAPVQPGMSGGPVVSDGGEVLGITVGTLNAVALAQKGVIPQNVNFALESRYVAKFLQKNNLTFTSVEPNTHGDLHNANQAALAAVVDVQCYE